MATECLTQTNVRRPTCPSSTARTRLLSPFPRTPQSGTRSARLRLSTLELTSPFGLAIDGEVEDYVLLIEEFNDVPTLDPIADIHITEDNDEDEDGQIDVVTVELNGISSGGEDDQLLQVDATTDNVILITGLATSFLNGGDRGVVSFVAAEGASGAATIQVTVREAGADGTFNTTDDRIVTREFDVKVAPINDPPTYTLAERVLTISENDGPQFVLLSGISAGESSQDVTVSVTSDTPSLFSVLQVNYSVGSDVGELTFQTAPSQTGSGNIILTFDDGETTVTETIAISVSERNDPPTLASVAPLVLDPNPGLQTVTLSGLSAGIGENSQFILRAEAFTPEYFEFVEITHVPGAGNATLSFKPLATAQGSGGIVVEVIDAGVDGTFDTSDDLITAKSVFVSVNRTPTLNAINDLQVALGTGLQTVSLAGLSDGDRADFGTATRQPFLVSVTTSLGQAIGSPTVIHDTANFASIGQLTYMPLSLGTSELSVTVTDAGWDTLFGNDDDRAFTRTFQVTVVDPSSNLWHNSAAPLDVDGDGATAPLDALLIVNYLNEVGIGALPTRSRSEPPYVDVNNDNSASPLDVLLVINAINLNSSAEGESVLRDRRAERLSAIREMMDQVYASQAASATQFAEGNSELSIVSDDLLNPNSTPLEPEQLAEPSTRVVEPTARPMGRGSCRRRTRGIFERECFAAED